MYVVNARSVSSHHPVSGVHRAGSIGGPAAVHRRDLGNDMPKSDPPKLLVAEPQELCLPPIDEATLPTTGPRDAVALDGPLTENFGGAMYAMIGHSDIRGRGQNVGPALHVDPFVMCNYACLPPGRGPPFCAHPHCGASIVSIFLSGGAFLPPWDNVQGPEARGPLLPGGIYYVDSGAVSCHARIAWHTTA